MSIEQSVASGNGGLLPDHGVERCRSIFFGKPHSTIRVGLIFWVRYLTHFSQATMIESVVQRAVRMAASDPDRQRVLSFLQKRGRAKLVEAASRHAVPAAAVSGALIDAFGAAIFASPVMRRFCGLACAAVLAEEGFVPDRTNVRIPRDPLFGYGSTYRRIGEDRENETVSLLSRFITTLNEAELREAEQLIQDRIRALRPARSQRSRT